MNDLQKGFKEGMKYQRIASRIGSALNFVKNNLDDAKTDYLLKQQLEEMLGGVPEEIANLEAFPPEYFDTIARDLVGFSMRAYEGYKRRLDAIPSPHEQLDASLGVGSPTD
jgi:hypothetical protein